MCALRAVAPVPLLYDGCLLGGFLSYKIALLTQLAADMSPAADGADVAAKPKLVVVQDELDMYGAHDRPQLATDISGV